MSINLGNVLSVWLFAISLIEAKIPIANSNTYRNIVVELNVKIAENASNETKALTKQDQKPMTDISDIAHIRILRTSPHSSDVLRLSLSEVYISFISSGK